MAGAQPPLFEVTSTNHAAWVVAVTITFLVYSIAGVLIKLFYRLRLSNPKSYDWCLISAVLCVFIHSVLVVRACVNGLGKHQTIVSDTSLLSFNKDIFVGSLFVIFTYVLTKISVILFVMAINPGFEFKLASYSVLGVVAAWGITSVFLLGFRCQLSSPWSTNDKCLDEVSVNQGINIVNILTDLALIVLPAVMMWSVQTATRNKAIVIALFATRILVPILITLQTVYLSRNFDPKDKTWTLVEPSILGHIAVNVSILTACMPSLKGVIEMFYSGVSTFIVPTTFQTSYNHSGSHSDGIIRKIVPSRFRSGNSGNGSYLDNSHLRSRGSKKTELGEQPQAILERSESQRNLREDAIMRTTEYEVLYETAGRPSSPKNAHFDQVSQDSTERGFRR